MNDKIRVILFKEGEAWLAQGLEHDICVQADTLEDLYGRFEVAVRLENDEEGGIGRIGPAPDYFQKLWEKRSGAYTPVSEAAGKYDFGLAA